MGEGALVVTWPCPLPSQCQGREYLHVGSERVAVVSGGALHQLSLQPLGPTESGPISQTHLQPWAQSPCQSPAPLPCTVGPRLGLWPVHMGPGRTARA